ncbi:unnamed protein product [Symbiodinium sp. CCMP2592]|nr:unnamed protein product [Symbiodinium sp. CCMP2592]
MVQEWSSSWQAVVVSLEQRADRRRRVAALLEPYPWLLERLRWLPAVCGQSLAPERLVPHLLSNVHSEEQEVKPRYEMLEGTSTCWNHDWLHMTPGAVGCALSHRVLWESFPQHAAACDQDWLLVLEDDLLWVASDLEQRLGEVLRQLPEAWHLCYLGWHGQGVIHLALGDTGPLTTVGPLEPWSGEAPLGTFAYLVSRAGAKVLLEAGSAFPLRRQLDAQLSQLCADGSLRRCLSLL